MTVVPHDDLIEPGGTPTGRRLARNTQLVLIEESQPGPRRRPRRRARGTSSSSPSSWPRPPGPRSRTSNGPAAWSRHCGPGWCRSGWPRVRDARADAVAHRRHPLTGLSEFADLDEPPPPAVPAEAPLGPTAFAAAATRPLRRAVRGAAGRADRIAEATGRRPEVFLVTLGPPAVHTAAGDVRQEPLRGGGHPRRRRTWLDGRRRRPPPRSAPAAPRWPASARATRSTPTSPSTSPRRVAAAGPRRLYLAGRRRAWTTPCGRPGSTSWSLAGGDALSTLTAALDAVRRRRERDP